jgi:hypothetical protein
MRILRRMGQWPAAGVLMLALGSAGQGSQTSGAQPGSQIQQIVPLGPLVPADPRVTKMAKDVAREASVQRQKKLVDDTAKLLELANELKAAVDKSNKDTMSLDVVRKADAIEKLAHSVKEGMKGS